MTQLQLTNKQINQNAELEKRKQDEVERSNRAKERIERTKAALSFVGKGADGIFKLGPKVPLNDLAWHANNAELLKARGSFSWGSPNGSVSSREYYGDPGIVVTQTLFNPGYIDQSLGQNVTLEDLAVNLFANVRAGKSGVASYSPSDIMQMMFAVASAVAAISYYETAYRVLNLESNAENLYIKRGLLAAFNMTDDFYLYKDIVYNAITDAKNKLREFTLPGSIPLFHFAYSMYNHILIDGDIKGILYVNRPYAFYRYDWANAQLTPVLVSDNPTPQNFVSPLMTVISSLYSNSDTFEVMRSDIKSYVERGNHPSLELAGLSKDAVIRFDYDREILEMMRNAAIVAPSGTTLSNLNITQSENKFDLVFKPRLDLATSENRSAAELYGHQMMQSDLLDPNEAEAMLNSRWMVFFKTGEVTPPKDSIDFDIFPMMAVTNVFIYTFARKPDDTSVVLLGWDALKTRALVATDEISYRYARFSNLKYLPNMMSYYDDNISGKMFQFYPRDVRTKVWINAQNLAPLSTLDRFTLWGQVLET